MDIIKLQLKSSAGTVLAFVDVRATGGTQNWSNATALIGLPGGNQTIRIYSSIGRLITSLKADN